MENYKVEGEFMDLDLLDHLGDAMLLNEQLMFLGTCVECKGGFTILYSGYISSVQIFVKNVVLLMFVQLRIVTYHMFWAFNIRSFNFRMMQYEIYRYTV